MEVVQGHHDLSSIQPCSGFIKSLLFAQVEKQLATNHEVHYQVEASLRLERIVKLDYEGASHILQYFPLCSGVYLLVALGYELLLYDLHSVQFACVILQLPPVSFFSTSSTLPNPPLPRI